MFLVEAAMIGLIGGLIGLGVSYIFGAAANFGGSEISFLGMYFQNGAQLPSRGGSASARLRRRRRRHCVRHLSCMEGNEDESA